MADYNPDEFDTDRYEFGMMLYKRSEYALWELLRVRGILAELQEEDNEGS